MRPYSQIIVYIVLLGDILLTYEVRYKHMRRQGLVGVSFMWIFPRDLYSFHETLLELVHLVVFFTGRNSLQQWRRSLVISGIRWEKTTQQMWKISGTPVQRRLKIKYWTVVCLHPCEQSHGPAESTVLLTLTTEENKFEHVSAKVFAGGSPDIVLLCASRPSSPLHTTFFTPVTRGASHLSDILTSLLSFSFLYFPASLSSRNRSDFNVS